MSHNEPSEAVQGRKRWSFCKVHEFFSFTNLDYFLFRFVDDQSKTIFFMSVVLSG